MSLFNRLCSINAVEAVSYLATTVLLTLVIDDALNRRRPTDAYDVVVEILQYASDNIEFICNEAGIASETIAAQIRAAIHEAKSKNRDRDKGKGEKGNDKPEDTENEEENDSNISEDDKTADEIISEEKKGSVRQRFPKEWLDKTKSEIERAAKQGNESAQTAKKILTDKAFDKTSNSTRSKKGK